MPTGRTNDPYLSFNFRIEIDGVPSAGFSECGGLTAIGDVVEYREGTDLSPTVRKLVGLQKYSNITLKRGYTQNMELWDWYKNIANGNAERRNCSIILMNEERQDVLRWHVKNAWIKKIDGPSLRASGNEVAFESIELAHEGLTLEK